MANRSNRRRQNPQMSRCAKHVEAIGSWRANSPSWPCIETMLYPEAEYTCAVGTGAKARGLAMRRSPYTVIDLGQLKARPFERHPLADIKTIHTEPCSWVSLQLKHQSSLWLYWLMSPLPRVTSGEQLQPPMRVRISLNAEDVLPHYSLLLPSLALRASSILARAQ